MRCSVCSQSSINCTAYTGPTKSLARKAPCSERRGIQIRCLNMSMRMRSRNAFNSTQRMTSGPMPALPTDAHRIIAREALRQCRNGVNAWMRLSLVSKEWAAALRGAHC